MVERDSHMHTNAGTLTAVNPFRAEWGYAPAQTLCWLLVWPCSTAQQDSVSSINFASTQRGSRSRPSTGRPGGATICVQALAHLHFHTGCNQAVATQPGSCQAAMLMHGRSGKPSPAATRSALEAA